MIVNSRFLIRYSEADACDEAVVIAPSAAAGLAALAVVIPDARVITVSDLGAR